MSYFDHDESLDSNEDIDAFEQQLRSIRPSPATQSWSSVAESIETSLDQPSLVSKSKSVSSVWRHVVSHSITAAIGLAVGVVLMLNLPVDDLVSTEVIVPVELASQQNADDTQVNQTGSLATASEASPKRSQRLAPDWRPNHLAKSVLRSGPLRVFGPIGNSTRLTQAEMEFNSSQTPTQPRDPNDDDSSIEQINDSPRNKPILSPRSLHLFLDELTCLPTLDVPFSKAKGCQS